MGRSCVWRRDRMSEDCVFGDGIGCGKIVCLATG